MEDYKTAIVNPALIGENKMKLSKLLPCQIKIKTRATNVTDEIVSNQAKMPHQLKHFNGMVNIRDVIAPSVEIDFNNLKISNMYYRTIFISRF